MLDDQNAAPATVITVNSPTGSACDYCGAALPPPRNHNGEVRRFCPGSRCRSGWHARERRRTLERARDALTAAQAAVEGALGALAGLLR